MLSYVAFIFIASMCFVYSQNNFQYAVIMDGGSSGTRAYIYNWRAKQIGIPHGLLHQVESMKTTPGISVQTPQSVNNYLTPLIDFVKNVSFIPLDLRPQTPLFLLCTAGMRIIPLGQQKSILDAVRTVFSSSGFLYKPQFVKVISGIEEGIYGWAATNYLLSLLDYVEGMNTATVLDLGGASTQVTFYDLDQTWPSNHVPMVIGTKEYSLYSYSYLYFGNDQFRQKKNDYLINKGILVDPCSNFNYSGNITHSNQTVVFITGSGNATACRDIIVSLFNLANNSLSSINGNYMPVIPDSQLVVAINAYYSAKILYPNISNKDNVTVQDFFDGANYYCSLDYSTLFPQDPKFAATNCFLANIAAELLYSAYHLPLTKGIYCPQYISNTEITWALGAAIEESQILDYYILSNSTTNGTNYAVLFDAGSSGTRIYVYSWPIDYETRIPTVNQVYSFKVNPGVSSYYGNFAGLNASLQTLLTASYDFTPAAIRSEISLYLFATAGMRILNDTARLSVITDVRTILGQSQYRLKRADVISGTEEGLFGWVTTNYLQGLLQEEDPLSSIGALDLGGASTQITFVPAIPPPSSNHVPLQIGNTVYDTYTFSYLYFGNDQARSTKNNYLASHQSSQDPCSPSGSSFVWKMTVSPFLTVTFNGTSNYTACAEIIRTAVLQMDANSPAGTSINGNYQPIITTEKFVTFSSYYYCVVSVNETFGIYSSYNLTLSDFRNGAQQYCSAPVSTVNITKQAGFVLTNCFQCALAVELLSTAYHMNDSQPLIFADYGWNTGAILFEASLIQAQTLDVLTAINTTSITPTPTMPNNSTIPTPTTPNNSTIPTPTTPNNSTIPTPTTPNNSYPIPIPTPTPTPTSTHTPSHGSRLYYSLLVCLVALVVTL